MLEISIYKKWPTFELDLQLHSERETIGVLGASGAGKSMLLRCIAGLVKPDAGRIQVNGRVLYDSEKKINLPPRERHVGFLFQNFALFPHLTVSQNIGFGLAHLSAAERQTKAVQLMEKFHLKAMGDRYPSQISGGQQQRVALARAMAVEPEILLLDEPFSALDDHLRNHMLKEMEGYLKDFSGSTLYVTHHMEEGYRLCNKIAILHAGRVEAFDAKEVVFQTPKTLETAKITGCKNLATAKRVKEKEVHLSEWAVTLTVLSGGPIGEMGRVGIRANQLKLVKETVSDSESVNRLPVWIADLSELPFKSMLYLKIGSPPSDCEDYHLQWEVPREMVSEVQQRAQPFQIRIEPGDIHWLSQ